MCSKRKFHKFRVIEDIHTNIVHSNIRSHAIVTSFGVYRGPHYIVAKGRNTDNMPTIYTINNAIACDHTIIF